MSRETGARDCGEPNLSSNRLASGGRSAATRQRRPTGSFYAKREASGQFNEQDEVGRSQRADRRVEAKTVAKSGFGEQGDQKRTLKRGAKRRATNESDKLPTDARGFDVRRGTRQEMNRLFDEDRTTS